MQLTFTYNYETDKTTAKLSGHEGMPEIHVLDFLKDCAFMATELYNERLAEDKIFENKEG